LESSRVIKLIESVQCRATKLVTGMQGLHYNERLKQFDWFNAVRKMKSEKWCNGEQACVITKQQCAVDTLKVVLQQRNQAATYSAKRDIYQRCCSFAVNTKNGKSRHLFPETKVYSWNGELSFAGLIPKWNMFGGQTDWPTQIAFALATSKCMISVTVNRPNIFVFASCNYVFIVFMYILLLWCLCMCSCAWNKL